MGLDVMTPAILHGIVSPERAGVTSTSYFPPVARRLISEKSSNKPPRPVINFENRYGT